MTIYLFLPSLLSTVFQPMTFSMERETIFRNGLITGVSKTV